MELWFPALFRQATPIRMPSRAQDDPPSLILNDSRPLAHSPFRPIAHAPISLDNPHFLAMFLRLAPVAP